MSEKIISLDLSGLPPVEIGGTLVDSVLAPILREAAERFAESEDDRHRIWAGALAGLLAHVTAHIGVVDASVVHASLGEALGDALNRYNAGQRPS